MKDSSSAGRIDESLFPNGGHNSRAVVETERKKQMSHPPCLSDSAGSNDFLIIWKMNSCFVASV